MKSNTLNINLTSEVGRLKTVIMCFANPTSIYSLMRYGAFDIPSIYQMLNNQWQFYDYKKVIQQQEIFINFLRNNGVEVLLADQISDCVSQHYTRDIGFAIADTFFCANPRRYYRQRELVGLKNLLPYFSKVAYIDNGSIEGGDVIIDNEYVIIGLSEETNLVGVNSLRQKLEDLNINKKVITLKFNHRGIIHLDTKFNIVDDRIAIIYSKSFKSESLKWLAKNFDLIEATEEEANNIEINTLTLAPKKVVMLKHSQRLASILNSKGIETFFVDYSEVTKLPGSFRCTTLPIERV
ncbi:MAG: dimethylarginine dimethylaminohydrolase family protein [Nodularia sp. CChRGM 3473]